MSRNDKRSKFTQTKKSNTSTYVIAGVVVIALALGGLFYTSQSKNSNPDAVNVGAVSYQKADFVKTSTTESNGDIVIDLKELKDKKTITFDIPGINFTLGNGTPFDKMPVLAYVSPKGDIVVATSICEPCSGINFHVEGEDLVCNACGTRWTLNDLQGISGGCPQYPPEQIKYSVDGDKLIIKKADVQNWQPRQV